MLDSMRRAAKSWVAKALMAVLVLSFAVWGIADIFRGYGQGSVITVGETVITDEEFRTALDREIRIFSQRFGQGLSMDQARAFGLDQRLIGRLVSEAVLDEAARRMSLGASDEAIARQIANDPNFRNSLGQFDRGLFSQILRSNGFSEQAYLAAERDAALREQLTEALAGGVSAPDMLTEAVHRFQNETRRIAYLAIGPQAIGEIAAPEEAALEAYYNENKQAFRAPEYRKLGVLRLEPEQLAKTIDVTEEDVRQVYESQKNRFTTPERRAVDQIVFADAQAARAASDRIKAGASFDAIATERNLKPEDVSLGLRTRAELLDPAVAEAAFALAPGAVSEPVEGRFGTVLLRLREVEPGSVKQLDEAHGQIRNEIAQDRAARDILDVQEKVEDERAGGASLADIGSRLNLPFQRIEAIDREGKAPNGEPVENAPARKVLDQAFQADVGIEIDPVSLDNGGYGWVDVEAVTPARDRELTEVREEAVRRWKEQEARSRLNDLASALVKEIEGGKTLEAVAAERGLAVEEAGPFKRGETPAPLSASAVSTAFATPEGAVNQALAADAPGRIVFRVSEVAAPREADGEQAKAFDGQIERSITDDLLAQYITFARDEIGVRINQAALARLLGQQTPQ